MNVLTDLIHPTIPGALASGTVTSNNTNVSNNDTVTINGRVYTFKTTLTVTPTADEIFIGASADASLTNLKSAINNTGTPGTDYGTPTTINADVTSSAVASHVITLTAKATGFAGNQITLAKSAVTLTVSATTLSGGTGGELTSVHLDTAATYTTDPIDVSTYGQLIAVLTTASHAGTSPTLDVKFQISNDKTNWVDSGDAFTQVTTSDGTTLKVLTPTFGPWLRAVLTLGGTTPDYALTLTLSGKSLSGGGGSSGSGGVASHVISDSGSVVAATQSGTWNVGTVTAVTAITNALPAGTNVIGHAITDAGSVTAATLSAETTKVIGTVNIAASQTVGIAAGSAVIGHVISDTGSVTAATLSAETTKVIGVVRNADGSGNLLTSTSNALDVNLKTSSITVTTNATLAAETSKVIGTVNQGTSPWIIGGSVASGATDANNPVKIGFKYNASNVTVTDGQRVDAQATVNGFLRTDLGTALSRTLDSVDTQKYGTPTVSTVSVATSSTSVLSSNAARFGFLLVNVGANNIYINLAGGTAVTTNTLLVPNGSYESTSYVATSAITGIAATGATNLSVTEYV